jgi:serine/threonine protein kinase/tetratricopeptide (TPR) repeat protein
MNDDDKTRTHIVLAQGTMVSHYRIIEKIGAGGMGEVYLAEDTQLDRKVALKFLPAHLSKDEDARTRFTREAKAVAKLDHPNIVQVFEVGEFKGRPFFAMAHIEGKSLREVIGGGKLSIDQAITFTKQICEGLHHAHESGIVHRDIKPGNIVIDEDNKARILDFGLATVAGEDRLTRTGSTLGTVGYMSPEQIEGRRVDRRSDLFSAGVILYEMLTGRRPFAGDNDAAVARSITDTTPDPIARYKSGTTGELQQIVEKALAKDPDLRYQNATGMLVDLKRIGAAATAKQVSRSGRYVVAIAVLVVIVLLLVVQPWKSGSDSDIEPLAQENLLAVIYFDNVADPTDSLRLGEIAANLLITDLSETEDVSVVSSQRLYDILRLLGHEGEKRIGRSLATEVAQKAKSKWMLLGSILQTEPALVVTSQLVDVSSGSAIASQRINGRDKDNIFTLVDSLSIEVKKDLSLPIQTPDARNPATAGYTQSTEAYRLFLEGWEETYRYNTQAAQRKFQEAIRIDSSFTAAYFSLSMTATDRETQVNAISRALEDIENVREPRKHVILARKAQLDGDQEKAIEELREFLKKQPYRKGAWNWLGTIYQSVDTAKALECFNRAIEIDPQFKVTYNALAYLYNNLGDFDKSIWAINKYIEVAPDEPNPYDTRGDLYALHGHLAKAIESYEKALSIDPDFDATLRKLPGLYVLNRQYDKAEKLFRELVSNQYARVRADGRRLLARIPMHQGRFKEAIRILDAGIQADKLEMGDGVEVAEKLWLRSVINGVHLKDYEAGISDLEKTIAIRDSINPKDDFIPHLMAMMARFYAAEGAYDTAAKVVQSTKARIEQNGSSNYRNYDLALAFVALEGGDSAKFSEIWNEHATSPFFASDYLMAVSHFGAGQIGDAVHLLESTMAYYDANRANWPATSVKAHYWLAKCYEASGWTNKAIEQYNIFLDIWKDADNGIPEVGNARKRLAGLKETI